MQCNGDDGKWRLVDPRDCGKNHDPKKVRHNILGGDSMFCGDSSNLYTRDSQKYQSR